MRGFRRARPIAAVLNALTVRALSWLATAGLAVSATWALGLGLVAAQPVAAENVPTHASTMAPGSRGSAALPEILTYPGGCRSNIPATLQECIDSAVSGDDIVIETDTIDEHVTIQDKSLSLGPGLGYHPSITQGASFVADNSTYAWTVQGIHFGAIVIAQLTGGTDHALTLDADRLTSSTATIGRSSVSAALYVDAQVPVRLTATSNLIQVRTDFGAGVSLESNTAAGQSVFRLTGNRIVGTNKAGTAIGVRIDQGSAEVDAYNNVVRHFSCPHCFSFGIPAGIGIDALGNTTALVNLVGNTIDDLGFRALYVNDRVTAPGHVTVNLFNSIISNVHNMAADLDSSSSWGPGSLSLHAGHQDYYAVALANHLEGRSLGSHNFAVKPRYQDATNGDLRLKPSSPLLDRGVVCSAGGTADPDASGNHRLFGASVDLGAYERGSAAPTGVVEVGHAGPDAMVGTSGDDIICGMGGSDTLIGKGGNDYLDGGSGSDKLIGGTGSDRLYGRAGSDKLCARDGVGGNDSVNGGLGTDAAQVDPGDIKVSVETSASC